MKPFAGSRALPAPHAFLLVCLLWTGIYLPGLGSLPLKHEEPRRALPALRMAAAGGWLVPRIGASPYLRKPPLLNWLIALSFRTSGGPSEFAARLPSVLAMLALGLTIIGAGRRWLGNGGALLAAIFVLTNLAAMETGRLAELEALYLSLTGIALLLWLSAWRFRASPWRLWCVPAPFLALAMLTKGPANLVFFYGVAGAVLCVAREGRTLLHPAHALALVVTAAPFLAWAIPCAAAVSASDPVAGAGGAWGFWWRELASRASVPAEGHFVLGEWLLHVPQGFINFLPWSVLLPLLWAPSVRAQFAAADAREWVLFRGARWGMAATFVGMSLLPSGSARYVYPLLLVPGVLLARALTVGEHEDGCRADLAGVAAAWRVAVLIFFAILLCAAAAMPFFAVDRGLGGSTGGAAFGAGVIIALVGSAACWRFHEPPRVLPLAIKSAVGMAAVTAIFAIAAVPRLNQPRAGLSREVARSIRAHLPADQTLGVMDAGYHAFWYYLEPRVIYFRELADAPFADARVNYFLLPLEARAAFIKEATRREVALVEVLETSDLEHHSFVLFARGPLPFAPPAAISKMREHEWEPPPRSGVVQR